MSRREVDLVKKMFADEGRIERNQLVLPVDFLVRLEKRLALDSPKVGGIANDIAGIKPRIAELATRLGDLGLTEQAASMTDVLSAIEAVWRELHPEEGKS